jgi:hypothetical protein
VRQRKSSLLFSLSTVPYPLPTKDQDTEISGKRWIVCKYVIGSTLSNGLCIHYPGSETRTRYPVDFGGRPNFPPQCQAISVKTKLCQPEQLPKLSKTSGFVVNQGNGVINKLLLSQRGLHMQTFIVSWLLASIYDKGCDVDDTSLVIFQKYTLILYGFGLHNINAT